MAEKPKVVILCGGLGTRLREETEFKPKPMVEIGGMPILWHLMKIYSHYGFKDFILCLGYKGNAIKEYFSHYKLMNNDFSVNLSTGQKTIHSAANDEDWSVSLIDTGNATMTGGRIKRIEKYIDGDNFMATYGDAVADVDITKLLESHKQKNKKATLTAVNPTSRYGNLAIDENQAVTSFKEKPPTDDNVNGGFFVFQKDVFDYLTGDSCVLEQQPLERLSKERQLSAYLHRGFWQCMDTYRDFTLLNNIWSSGNVPWKVW